MSKNKNIPVFPLPEVKMYIPKEPYYAVEYDGRNGKLIRDLIRDSGSSQDVRLGGGWMKIAGETAKKGDYVFWTEVPSPIPVFLIIGAEGFKANFFEAPAKIRKALEA